MRELTPYTTEHNSLQWARLEIAWVESAAAQRTVIVVAERIFASLVQDRARNIVNFCRLHPTTFSGTGEQVDVVKMQLTDVARTWKSEETILERSIVWNIFFDGFYVRFFPLTAQDDIGFIELRQEGMMIDAYAVKFSRLSRFSPSLVAEERNRACNAPFFQLFSKIEDTT